MALILSLETSEHICSVAISNEYELLGCAEITDGKSHASMLTILIERLLTERKIEYSSLNALSVSMGPGSYTGLRIGISVAKGICYALNIPLIAINSLQIITEGALQSSDWKKIALINDDVLLCAMTDARRMEVYRAFFNSKCELIGETSAEILDEHSFSEILTDKSVVFFGSGSEKFRNIVNKRNAYFIDNIKPHAGFMVGLAYDLFQKNQFVDTAYFEPFYLKDFVATIAKKKILSF